MQLENVKAGDWIMADSGFICLKAGPHKVEAEDVQLYVVCDCGKHFLDGQVGADGELIGMHQIGVKDHPQ